MLSKSGRKILEKRHRFAQKYLAQYDKKIHRDIMNILLNTESKYTDRVFFPLFNYDYRKLLTSILEFGEVKMINGVEKSRINIDSEYYKRVSNISSEMGRGIFFNYLISYLIDRNNLSRFAEEHIKRKNINKLCKVSRIILTVIFNLNYPNGTVYSKEPFGINRPKDISLLELINELKLFLTHEVFGTDELYYWLSFYFTIHKSSWSHLITLYNKEHGGSDLDFTLEKELTRKYLNGTTTSEERDLLDQIVITINAAGVTYLRHMITHFEFYSCLDSHKKNKDSVPLIQLLDFNYSQLEYIFEAKVDTIISRIENCIELMDNYFSEIYVESFGLSVESFKSSPLSFKEDDSKGQLHATRILTRQISYLDEFRRFLMNDPLSRAKIQKIETKFWVGGAREINKSIVERIFKLAKLLVENKHNQDKSDITLFKKFKSKIERIEDSDFDPDFDLRISLD